MKVNIVVLFSFLSTIAFHLPVFSQTISKEEMVLMGLNTPIRIGNAIVLPGDLVIAQKEGVLFVPAHLAEQVVSTAEFVIRKDKFGFEMVRAGKYSTGEIDSQWSNEIKSEFLKWLEKHPELGKMTRSELDNVMSKRTW